VACVAVAIGFVAFVIKLRQQPAQLASWDNAGDYHNDVEVIDDNNNDIFVSAEHKDL